MSGVRVQDLAVRLGGAQVLRGINLEVEPGEFVVLLGPSGCGKSTLLNSLAGLVDLERGRVEIAGRDVTLSDPSERGIGMVFQSYALYPTMTVERNLSFGLKVSGLPQAEVSTRVQRVAQMLQLESLLKRKPAQLSGGQRQRVAIGRALVREASVFLLDEPLSNLDAQLRAELRREIKMLHQRLGATMIYVTHDQAEALTLASRLVVMRDGHIEQEGSPEELYEQPNSLFVAGFLGAPPMNLLHGALARKDGRLFFESDMPPLDLSRWGGPRGYAEEGPVTLGVRPEHVRIHSDGVLSATVQVVESMGSHQVIWIQAQGLELAALMAQTTGVGSMPQGGQGLRSGDAVRFDLDPPQLVLFDPVTGRRH